MKSLPWLSGLRLWVNWYEEGPQRQSGSSGKAEGRVVFGAFHVEGLGAGGGGALCSREWVGWSMWAALWAPERAAETGRVGEDHGGSARGEAASGSQGQRKSQREQGHGNPGMMDGCSVISPEMKKWL